MRKGEAICYEIWILTVFWCRLIRVNLKY